MADEAGEKTEVASEKRRKEYRDKGEIARSKDIISVLVLFSALAYFSFFSSHIYDGLSGVLTRFFTFDGDLSLTVGMVTQLGSSTIFEMAYIMAPLVGAIVVVSIVGSLAQTGVVLTTKPLEPDLNRLNFFTKFFQTFFNKQAIGTLSSSLVKIAVVVLVIYITLSGDGAFIKSLSTLPLYQGVAFVTGRCLEVILNVSIVLIFIAVADYMWNRYVMEEKMKMTKQEVKDEHKEYEGNPELKGQRRRRAMDMSNQRMMQAVPDADVIVNNPTHISVALRYRQGTDAAPIVLAKGADFMAMRIRRAARANNIPMVENKPLARSLYRNVKVGKAVPSKFFRAVAEVLAYVYRFRQSRGGQSIPSNTASRRSDGQ